MTSILDIFMLPSARPGPFDFPSPTREAIEGWGNNVLNTSLLRTGFNVSNFRFCGIYFINIMYVDNNVSHTLFQR